MCLFVNNLKSSSGNEQQPRLKKEANKAKSMSHLGLTTETTQFQCSRNTQV